MPRRCTKIEILSEETNREIAESYGLTKYQIKRLVSRQHRKARLIVDGYIPRSQGRSRRNSANEEIQKSNELIELRMKVELL